MAKFLFTSNYGDSAFLALKLKREGHQVRMFIKHPTCKFIYNGIIDKTNSARPERDDIVIIDSEGFGNYGDHVRKAGNLAIGGGAWADAIELDRAAGIGLMDLYGIRTPETHPFSDIGQAVKFLATQEGKWFYKPNGNKDAALSQGGNVDILTRYIQKFPTKEFILQRQVKGIELSIEGWFDGEKFVYPFNSTVEDKRFMAGDIGPNVGCMGNVVWTYDEPCPIVVHRTLDRIQQVIQRNGYVGPIDINTIITDDGAIYGLEWTPRFGYDAIQALCMLAPNNFGEQLIEFAAGRLNKFDLRGEYAMNVNTSVPPYPHTPDAMKVQGTPVDYRLLDHPDRIMPRDIMLDNLRMPVISGSSGIVASIGGIGKDLFLLRADCLAFVKEFKIPSVQYRNDCCVRAYEVIDKLGQLGFDLPFMAPEPIKVDMIEISVESPIKTSAMAKPASLSFNQKMDILSVPPADTGMAPRFE